MERGGGKTDVEIEDMWHRTQSCGGELGRYGPLALQFEFISVESLLPTIFKVIARMVLWQPVL